MTDLPYELSWGVDVAIKKLRPGAKFSLNGTTIESWEDPLGSEPPTPEEITTQLEKDRIAAETWLSEQNQPTSVSSTRADAEKWAR